MREAGASLWLAGAALSIREAAGVLGALTGGSISDRIGRRQVIVASLVLTPLLTFVFLFTKGWLQFPLLVLLGFVGLSTMPVILAMVQESFPESRALANGIYHAMGFLFNSVVVVIVGLLGDLFSLRVAFAVGAGAGLLGIPFAFLLPYKEPESRETALQR
jgi:FSR family fosmidomycin resistance protein-like MFS transporter